MTEANEDGNYLVRVRAQVMTRDDSSGGWVPLGGGGLSYVSVRKRTPTSAAPSSPSDTRSPARNGGTVTAEKTSAGNSNVTSRHGSTEDSAATGDLTGDNGQTPGITKHEYLIFGRRISDKTVVLSCTIKKDFEYNKVMPTFHHWKTGDKKFGLTFQTAADARAFDKGVRTAVEELLDGLTGTYPLSPLHKYPKDVADDDVFMTLNLPIEAPPPAESHGLIEGGGSSGPLGRIDSSPVGSQQLTGMPGPDHMHRIHYIQCSDRDLSPPVSKEHKVGFSGDNYYVQLTAVHEYIYPVVEDPKSASRQDSSLKKRGHEVTGPLQPALPPCKSKSQRKSHKYARTRCRHCNVLFSEDDNARGDCEFAPDCVRSGINGVSCISCAQCMLYHCMADAEGDFAIHPCECASADENCGRRWVGLALLSLLVPCLWCYPPLRACHWCGVGCGLCGGRHSA